MLDLVTASTSGFNLERIKYDIFRHFSFVRASSLRHSIPFPSSELLHKVLTNAVREILPLLASQVPLNSPVVELSSIVAYPNAERQKTYEPQLNYTSTPLLAYTPLLLYSCLLLLYSHLLTHFNACYM